MPWPSYVAFLAIAAAVVVIPGPDFAVVAGNTAAGGRRRGMWCAAGIALSNAIQGTAAVVGLGALVVNAQPVFLAIKWAGALYLTYLGIVLLRAAVRGRYAAVPSGPGGGVARGWRQGFLSNITNPKVLVFYLAVLPQFLTPEMGSLALAAFALSHALLSLVYLVALATVIHVARTLLSRRPVRRTLDAVTGVALVGFGARLALDRS
ncbi:MAG: LysE family translocator [Micromonosporaceae bacterium]|nr:LysE family translocator [Micromonosporaceae bacterium]